MKTLELKKEIVSTLETELNVHTTVRSSLESLLNDYVNFITDNVAPEFRKFFGIGVAGTHKQFGSRYGFKADDIKGEYDGSNYENEYYATPGNGYHIGNDFNSWVSGSNFFQMKKFAEQLHEWVSKGITELKKENKETQKILDSIKIN